MEAQFDESQQYYTGQQNDSVSNNYNYAQQAQPNEPNGQESSKDTSNTYNVYVGNLSSEVDENDLYQGFVSCGPIVSTRVFRKPETGEHMGYGFVHFATPEGQRKALTEEFNRPQIKGQAAYTKPAVEKMTLFVGSLPLSMDQQQVSEAIQQLVGPIQSLTLKTGPPPTCASRGFCFVQFDSHKAADNARKILSRTPLQGKILSVGWAEPLPNTEIDETAMSKVTTLFVNQVPMHVNDDDLKTIFVPYGEVTKCRIVRNPQTNESRGFAFVEFKEREACVNALNGLNNSEFQGAKLSIVFARPQDSRNRPGAMKRGDGMSGDLMGYDPMTGAAIQLPRNQFNNVMGRGGRGRGRGGRGRGRGGYDSNAAGYGQGYQYQQYPQYQYSYQQQYQQYQYPGYQQQEYPQYYGQQYADSTQPQQASQQYDYRYQPY